MKQKWNIYITRLASSWDSGGVASNLSTMILESLHHNINTDQSQKWKVCNVHLFNCDYQRERGWPQIHFPAVASCSLTQLELQPARKILLLRGKSKRKKNHYKSSFQPLNSLTVDICMVATQRNKSLAKDDWQPIKILSLHGELFEEFAQGDHESFSGYCFAKSGRDAWHKFQAEGFSSIYCWTLKALKCASGTSGGLSANVQLEATPGGNCGWPPTRRGEFVHGRAFSRVNSRHSGERSQTTYTLTG